MLEHGGFFSIYYSVLSIADPIFLPDNSWGTPVSFLSPCPLTLESLGTRCHSEPRTLRRLSGFDPLTQTVRYSFVPGLGIYSQL